MSVGSDINQTLFTSPRLFRNLNDSVASLMRACHSTLSVFMTGIIVVDYPSYGSMWHGRIEYVSTGFKFKILNIPVPIGVIAMSYSRIWYDASNDMKPRMGHDMIDSISRSSVRVVPSTTDYRTWFILVIVRCGNPGGSRWKNLALSRFWIGMSARD